MSDITPPSDFKMEPPPPVRRGLGIGSTLLLCLAFYFVFIAASVFVGIVVGVWSASGGDSSRALPNQFSLMLIPQILAWLVTIKLGLQALGVSFREACGLAPFPGRIIPALLVASVGATILLLEAASWIPMPESWREMAIEQHAETSWFAIFLPVVIVAPVAEEIYFRGLVLRGFMERYSVTKVIWASAIIFAVFHLNPWQGVVALPLGVWYAVITLRTGSVIPSLISHATVNFSANFVLTPLALLLGHDREEMVDWRHFPADMLLIGAAAVAVGGTILHRQMATVAPPPELEIAHEVEPEAP